MPGTIHVFVLDLMDLPFDGSPLILKLAMGKREYQTVGKGEYSFPVMSLRENLILMLHDKEGNELSRTELPTMSVVEKGIWDDLFPLEGGGHIRMRVQFSLNEEERLRIRQMRETVVRKKQSELLKDQETGLLGSFPTTKLFLDETKIEKTEQTDPGVCGSTFGTLSPQEFGESSAQASKQNDPHHTELSKKEIGIQHKGDVSSVKTSNSSLLDGLNECWKLSSEQMKPTKPEQLDTTYAGNVTEDSSSIGMENDQILETSRKGFHRRSLSSNVKKMITTFETTLYQGLEPSFSPNNIKDVKVPQILTKSFSAEMLSEIKSKRHPAVRRSIVEKKRETPRLYSDSGKSQELANDISIHDSKTANNALEPIETERAFSIRGMVENSDDDFHLSDKASRDVLPRQEVKTDHHVLAEEDLAARKMLDESVGSVRPCPYVQRYSSSITAMEGSGQINPQTSNEDVPLSRHSGSRGCSSPSLVSCVPRHFCITIGSKQLRDLVECCDLSVGTHLMDNYHFINEVHEKESTQGDGLLKMDENEEACPASKNSNVGHSKGMEKTNGVLIEQIVRTVLIIIAGGTLILNTRLRRQR